MSFIGFCGLNLQPETACEGIAWIIFALNIILFVYVIIDLTSPHISECMKNNAPYDEYSLSDMDDDEIV